MLGDVPLGNGALANAGRAVEVDERGHRGSINSDCMDERCVKLQLHERRGGLPGATQFGVRSPIARRDRAQLCRFGHRLRRLPQDPRAVEHELNRPA